MGYTHYWHKEPEIDADSMGAIVRDFGRLVLPLHDHGVPLANWDGKESPDLTADVISFNGLTDCGHPQNSEILIPWPTADAGGIATSRAAESGHWFAGVKIESRCCDGSCEYESFVFERKEEVPDWQAKESGWDGRAFNCCKTAFRPYDIAVTAALLVAKHHLGNRIKVSTDGEDGHWWDAKMLCQSVLGYGLEYAIVGRELLPVAGEAPYVQVKAQAQPEVARKTWDRNEAITEIKAALKRRSGRAWSVTGGRGTGWGWISIGLLPREERLPDEQRHALYAKLHELLGTNSTSVPACSSYRAEYVDRANGRTPTQYGEQYWD